MPATTRRTISRLDKLARNLRWTWQADAQRLFAGVDPELWDASQHNPIRMLRMLSPERRDQIEHDKTFVDALSDAENSLKKYLKARTWFDRNARGRDKQLLVAYFSMEFGLHESMPQYSGGLGVLAGDHLKSASDLGIPLVGVGLVYRRGYYTQGFAADGSTRVTYPHIEPDDLCALDTEKTITVPAPGRAIRARLYVQQVGRVRLVLLDADVYGNSSSDRRLTDHLYGGDREYRIRQETLLGVGGVLALEALNIRPTVYHLNEGHAAFCATERLRQLVNSRVSLDDAKDRVRRSTVFTTHTPVPAGNERFAPKLAWKYLRRTASELGLSRQAMLALGREDASDRGEEFCMTVLALLLSKRCNGVAKLHGDTSRKMWKKVYNVDDPDKVPIGHVTNGVHTQTWMAPEAEMLFRRHLGLRWETLAPNRGPWKRAAKIPADEFWSLRNHLRRRLIQFVRRRLVQQALRRHATVEEIAQASQALDENALTIGFARRFATYKRAPLAFHDPRRLARILTHVKTPVQIIFAGKAHPQDAGGQEFAQRIFRFTQREPFRGRVVLLEDYDMELGRMLTSGCDVWLNNPLRPQEASGTSGMKSPLHGGINCSIPDGWWPEAYDKTNGWQIGDGEVFDDPARQDRHDAGELYKLLERRLVPEFYARDRRGVPKRWIARMKRSLATVAGQFSTHRMVGQYLRQYYLPTHGDR